MDNHMNFNLGVARYSRKIKCLHSIFDFPALDFLSKRAGISKKKIVSFLYIPYS